jgi:hypothetical protein
LKAWKDFSERDTIYNKLSYLYDSAWGKMVSSDTKALFTVQVRVIFDQDTEFIIQGLFNKLLIIFVFSAGWGIFLSFDLVFSMLAKVVRFVRGKKGMRSFSRL